MTVKKTERLTTVYTFTGKLIVILGAGEASYPIALNKESVTVSGSTKYNSLGKANMTITFLKDNNVENNKAIQTSTISDATGAYTLELSPGSYNVTVLELVNESGQNITYEFTGKLMVSSGDAPRTYEILLDRKPTS